MLKTAIIGAGGVAELHVAAMKRLDVSPAIVVAATEDEARSFAERFRIPEWTTDTERAFGEEIKAVHLCTPPSTHGDLVRTFLEYGKHIYCEKPLCLDAEEAAQLARKARAAGSVCTVGFNVRFYPACQEMRRTVQTDFPGKPVLIHGSYLQSFHAMPAPYQWRYDREIGGRMRAVTEIGSHWLDLAQFISGLKITAVSAKLGRFFPKRRLNPDGMMVPFTPDGVGKVVQVESEDAAAISLRFENSAMGCVVLSEISPGRDNRISLEVTCSDGNLWWNSDAKDVFSVAKKGDPVLAKPAGFGTGFGDTFYFLIRAFYETILNPGAVETRRLLPTFEDGARNAAICAAIEESDRWDSKWTPVQAGEGCGN